MTFIETEIEGCYVFYYDKKIDSRGDFSRILCCNDLSFLDINFVVKQSSIATNRKKDTARGLHYQKDPHGENKIITCVSGVIDVFILDLRKEPGERHTIIERLDSRLSSTELLYVPKYCASGYITLEDNSAVLYYMDEYYHEESQKTIGFNIDCKVMSEKDSRARGKK